MAAWLPPGEDREVAGLRRAATPGEGDDDRPGSWCCSRNSGQFADYLRSQDPTEPFIDVHLAVQADDVIKLSESRHVAQGEHGAYPVSEKLV